MAAVVPLKEQLEWLEYRLLEFREFKLSLL